MHLPLGKWGCLGCSTVPGTGKPLTSCSQVQERVLLWNSVLRCCCNSSELYSPLFFISPTVHILLVWNFPVSRSTQFPEATVCFLLPKSLGPCLLLGAHTQFSFANGFFFFFCLLAFWSQPGQPQSVQCLCTSTRGMATAQFSFFPEIAFLQPMWSPVAQWTCTWAYWWEDLVSAVSMVSVLPCARIHFCRWVEHNLR